MFASLHYGKSCLSLQCLVTDYPIDLMLLKEADSEVRSLRLVGGLLEDSHEGLVRLLYLGEPVHIEAPYSRG